MHKTPVKRRQATSTAAGRKIIDSLKGELDGRDRGEAGPTREVVGEPSEYTAADIQALRAKVGVSQREFAHFVGVSSVLVSSWEQGIRTPNRLARRMLDQIKKDISRLLARDTRSARGAVHGEYGRESYWRKWGRFRPRSPSI